MKILFFTGRLHFRGSCTALFDYADYNERLLGGKSCILTKRGDNHDAIAQRKFETRFPVLYYDTDEDFIRYANQFDAFYTITYGHRIPVISKLNTRVLVHCVFDMTEPHGDVYAGVSETLARKFGSSVFVPHMVALTPTTSENMRKELGIPADHTVFGRHGGMDTFNLDFGKTAIAEALDLREDIHFVLLNTSRFIDHPRVHFLAPIIDNDEKSRFIRACDAGLELGFLGHTFGLAIAEFSVHNRPTIAYNGPLWNRAHLDILGEKCLLFQTKEQLVDLFVQFDRTSVTERDWNAYRSYSPAEVMKIFQRVFLL